MSLQYNWNNLYTPPAVDALFVHGALTHLVHPCPCCWWCLWSILHYVKGFSGNGKNKAPLLPSSNFLLLLYLLFLRKLEGALGYLQAKKSRVRCICLSLEIQSSVAACEYRNMTASSLVYFLASPFNAIFWSLLL